MSWIKYTEFGTSGCGNVLFDLFGLDLMWILCPVPVSRGCICGSVLFIPWYVFIWGRPIELDDVSVQMLIYCTTR